MNLLLLVVIVLGLTTSSLPAQMDTLPYYEIPDYPDTYSETTTVMRMIDGLGYRYYWATDSLTAADLAYEPGNEGQAARAVLNHLGGLSHMINNVCQGQIHQRRADFKDLEWPELRRITLHNLHDARTALAAYEGSLDDLTIKFSADRSVPFWHMINGPIADAIYHVGQIVSYRRTTGNPMYGGVSVFSGRTSTLDK